MKPTIRALLPLVLITITGCASLGNDSVTDHGRYMKIKIGESRKQEVFQLFGQPNDVRYGDQSSNWAYYKVDVRMHWSSAIPFIGLATGGSDYNIQRTIFSFNSQDVLLDVISKQKASYVSQWVGIGRGLSNAGKEAALDRVKVEMDKYKINFDSENVINGTIENIDGIIDN